MSTKHQEPQKHSKQPATAKPKSAQAAGRAQGQQKDDALRHADEPAQKDKNEPRDRTGGQNRAVDQKRNDEQQYHAGGAAHDPHDRTQERVDSGDPDTGDVDEETRAEDAPFNKTYGHHE
jgi:hypothetical protein